MTREEAVDFLVSRRFAAPSVKKAAHTKAGGIKDWFDSLSTSQKGALLGALGGGGYGLISGATDDEEEGSPWWRSTLTGALGGGAAGYGAGALLQALNTMSQQSQAESTLADMGDASEVIQKVQAGDPDALKLWDSLTDSQRSKYWTAATESDGVVSNLFDLGADAVFQPDAFGDSAPAMAAGLTLSGAPLAEAARDAASLYRGRRYNVGAPQLMEVNRLINLPKGTDGFELGGQRQAFIDALGADTPVGKYFSSPDSGKPSKAFYEALRDPKSGLDKKLQDALKSFYVAEGVPDTLKQNALMSSADIGFGGSRQLRQGAGQRLLPNTFTAPTKPLKPEGWNLKGKARKGAMYGLPGIVAGATTLLSELFGGGGMDAQQQSEAMQADAARRALLKQNNE